MEKSIIFSCLMVFSYLSMGQVSIHIAELAANTPDDATLYFAGNINGWNPGDPDFTLEKREDGDHWIDLPAGSGEVQFKFTRGSWESVESNGNGGFRPNRSFVYGNGDTLHLSILGWEDLDNGGGQNSTANEQVMILDEAMWMPQLNRNRRIWVYLPKDYELSEKTYPVLYMHDGQNVFDASTSFAGEWKVDETLSEMEDEGFAGIIVVAIDNGGTHRIDEYSPFVNPQYGGGEGDEYLDFIIQTLKPRIDSSFRTRLDASSTGIMGSSMGGLISHYAHFRNPEVFGRAGIFSPSYWFSSQYFSYTSNAGKTDSARIYMLAGSLENTIAQSTQQMYNVLVSMGYGEDELRVLIAPDGQHSEWFWAREFEEAVSWLFPSQLSGLPEMKEPGKVEIYPNPARDSFVVKGAGRMHIRLFNIEGRLLYESELINETTVFIESAWRNLPLLIQVEKDGLMLVRKVLTF